MDGGMRMQGPPPARFFHMPRFQGQNNQQPQSRYMHQYRQHMMQNQNLAFDGKRMRKAVLRKTVDYNSSIVNYLENRVWQRDFRDQRALQTDILYQGELVPPPDLLKTPMNCVTTKFVRTSTNKLRCPIFCVCWTPEGRRLVTGASSGEFTLWNGLTFNFETILQAHDTSVRAMIWSHNDQWMVTGDHAGFVKYWQSNMNNVKMFQAHKDPVRGISFCPTDQKFATCSDDGTVRVWDFLKCTEEKILRGHGADVKCVDWHPQKALVASGSKDTQQPVKLWDPRAGTSLATIHAHKHTVMEVKWNRNGNWLLTASRDHLLKLFDIRNMKEEVQTFKGHKKEATTVAWHPIHESLFASGGSDGAIMFWLVGNDKEVGSIEEAHETMVWSLSWHPLGHILVSGSNDHTTKFWTRNRPGDKMRDKYNLNLLPVGMSEDMLEYDTDPLNAPSIPGMGLEYGLPEHLKPKVEKVVEDEGPIIPGLDFSAEEQAMQNQESRQVKKKVPYAKPIPRQFEQAWSEGKQPVFLTRRGEPDPNMMRGPPPQSFQGPPPGFNQGQGQQQGQGQFRPRGPFQQGGLNQGPRMPTPQGQGQMGPPGQGNRMMVPNQGQGQMGPGGPRGPNMGPRAQNMQQGFRQQGPPNRMNVPPPGGAMASNAPGLLGPPPNLQQGPGGQGPGSQGRSNSRDSGQSFDNFRQQDFQFGNPPDAQKNNFGASSGSDQDFRKENRNQGDKDFRGDNRGQAQGFQNNRFQPNSGGNYNDGGYRNDKGGQNEGFGNRQFDSNRGRGRGGGGRGGMGRGGERFGPPPTEGQNRQGNMGLPSKDNSENPPSLLNMQTYAPKKRPWEEGPGSQGEQEWGQGQNRSDFPRGGAPQNYGQSESKGHDEDFRHGGGPPPRGGMHMGGGPGRGGPGQRGGFRGSPRGMGFHRGGPPPWGRGGRGR